jgi:hypothetical protein
MRRGEQKARCILRETIIAQLLPDLISRARWLIYGGAFVTVLVVPLMGFGGAELVDSESPATVLLGMVLIGIAIVVGSVAFPLGIWLAFRAGKKADTTASRAARAADALVETMMPVRCNQCGGHARVVVLGASPAPCPWCGARLVAASPDAAAVAANAILAGQQNRADAALLGARIRAGAPTRSRFRLALPGFDLRGGVYEGVLYGAPVWIGFDITPDGIHRQVAIDRDTALEGAAWFVRREVFQLHARAAHAAGLSYPPGVGVPALDAHFAIHAEPSVDVNALVRRPAVHAMLQRLAPNESLHLDPAGATIWNIGGSMFGASHGDVVGESDALARTVAELA